MDLRTLQYHNNNGSVGGHDDDIVVLDGVNQKRHDTCHKKIFV